MTGAIGRSPVHLRAQWDRRDGHRVVTVVALALAVVAITMAVVGLPPVDLHGPLHRMGIMDPFCGGTRAARYTAQGNLAQAWRYNPLGILVVAGSMVLAIRTAVGLLARRWINLGVTMSPRARSVAICVVILLTALLEIRQQMRADLLMDGTSTWV